MYNFLIILLIGLMVLGCNEDTTGSDDVNNATDSVNDTNSVTDTAADSVTDTATDSLVETTADTVNDTGTEAATDTVSENTGTLTVDLSTSTAGGNYRPRHVLAIWIENNSGEFIHTLMAYARSRITHLNNWESSTEAAGVRYDTTDAVSGATQSSYTDRSATWNGMDFNGTMVPDGNYTVCMELTDKNSTGNYSCFAFEKTGTAQTVTPSDAPSFSNINIQWTPN